MSCCNSYPSCGCNAFVETSCGDPGLENSLKHIQGLDNQFCEKRLSNPTNGLGAFVSYGTNAWVATNDPQVKIGDVGVATGQIFRGMLANSETGFFRRIIPNNGVDGFVRADGAGNFYIQDPTDNPASIPDPLTLTTLNASNVNVHALVVSGTPVLSGLVSDTVVSFLGLNGGNQLVKGSVQTSSVAQFYESGTLTSPATPNFTYPATATSNVQIGNEISDPDGIAHVVSQEVVEIDVAGRYTIEWYGQYTGYRITGNTSSGNAHNPGLYLTVGGVIVSKGNVQTYQDANVGGSAFGKVDMVLAAGQQLRIRGNGSMAPTSETRGTGLLGVTLTLTKYN